MEIVRRFSGISTDEVLERVQKIYEEKLGSSAGELQKLNEEIKRIKKLRDFYINEYNKVILGEPTRLPPEVIEKQLKHFQNELNKAEQKKEELEKDMSAKPLNREMVKKLCENLKGWEEAFQGCRYAVAENPAPADH